MKNSNVKNMVVTAMLSAIAVVLMFIDFSVPFMPVFIKADISEMPALIASFAVGPFYGVAVCFIKNIANIMIHGSTGGIGELANFLMGAAFVLPAGYIYRYNKTKKGAMIGSLVGAVSMAALSLPINYYITYPMYARLMIPMETIVSMYQAILPSADSLFECLLIFNVPFTLLKGVLCSLITFLIYKRISHIIKDL